MKKIRTVTKRKMLFILVALESILVLLVIRVGYIQIVKSDWLQEKAFEQQTRDRLIKPNRGSILDRNGEEIATTKTVASISVINAQIEDKEKVAKELSRVLELEYEYVLEKVNKKVALERIKTKVDREVAKEIRELGLSGVKIDEDILRVYPYNNLASHTLGFVGKDNQGIIGLEAKYDERLKGEAGKILTETDARGIEVENGREMRVEPINGMNLKTTLDLTIQQYVEQTLESTLERTKAKRVSMILMDPNTGEILSMANKPDYNANDPFKINDEELEMVWDYLSEEEKNNSLNSMWRNFAINDTYEPGSTFKVITTIAGLEERVVNPDTQFVCNGHTIVGGIKIKCWRSPMSHGNLNLVEGVMNSCNPVFMDIADRLGTDNFYKYLDVLKLNERTGIDLAGEATGILHKLENVGEVELATMSFGQSFQITPIQLLRSVAITINGGYEITPHLGTEIIDLEGNVVEKMFQGKGTQVISSENSKIMRETLESVVYEGTGNKSYIPGYRIGGKTATSEKLPRRSGKYIASFLTFAPADDPKVIGLVLIDEPVGAYYGGQIAGPVMKEVLENVLPYLGIEAVYKEEELELEEVQKIIVEDYIGLGAKEVKKQLKALGVAIELIDDRTDKQKEEGIEGIVYSQIPRVGEEINKTSKIIVYVK